MSLCVMLIIIIHIIALMGMMSCSTHRHAVTVERETHTDTVYITSQQYDSIFIWKDRWTDRTHDTVYIRELSTEYRYKLLRDTLRIVERDSIHYKVTVTETRGGGKAFLVVRRAGKGGVLYCDSSCSRVGEDEKITVAKIVRFLENFPLRPPEMFPNTYQNNNFHKKNCYMFVF